MSNRNEDFDFNKLLFGLIALFAFLTIATPIIINSSQKQDSSMLPVDEPVSESLVFHKPNSL